MGRLECIWLKRAKNGPMDPVDVAVFAAGKGLEGNANRGGHRQVTIISRARWAELTVELDADIPPTARRANLMVSGIDLEKTRGRILRVGSTRLHINGETRPCGPLDPSSLIPHPGSLILNPESRILNRES